MEYSSGINPYNRNSNCGPVSSGNGIEVIWSDKGDGDGMDREKINYAKSELRNYMYLLNVCHGFENKILELQTKLEGVKSPSGKMGACGGSNRDMRRQKLLEKKQRYEFDLAAVRSRTDKIDNFLDNLCYEDRKIVTDVYINRCHIESVARKTYRSVRMLKYDIDQILLKF